MEEKNFTEAADHAPLELGHKILRAIDFKINSYLKRTGKRPQKIVIHHQTAMALSYFLSDNLSTQNHKEVERVLDVGVVRSLDVPEDFIGIIDDFFEQATHGRSLETTNR